VAASLREEKSDPGMKASGAQVTPRAGGWSVRVSGPDGFEEQKPEQHDPAWHGGNRPGQMVRGWSDRRGATGRCGVSTQNGERPTQ